MSTLFVRDGESNYGEAKPELIISTAKALLKRRLRSGAAVLNSPAAAKDYVWMRLCAHEHEVFGLIHLDACNKLIAIDELFRGTLGEVVAYPREVAKSALKHNAAAVICFHNHPSEDPTPSMADELVTVRLKEALSLLNIRLLDHWIVGGESMVSFREQGLL